MRGPDERRLPQVSADTPISRPDEDLLGRADFAEALAQAIARMPGQEGFVIALYGTWGSGKSSVLNLVQYYLPDILPGERPIVVTFDPWWFSGSESLLIAFLAQLHAALGRDAAAGERLRDLLTKYGGVIAGALKSIPWGQGPAEVIEKLADTLAERDVERLKQDIGGALRDLGHKLLVVMDDIDRLTAPEIRQVFQLVKAVADFPNTVYLLAFDEEVVSHALEEVQGGSGQDYLDKIVQVPFHLPLPDKQAIRGMFVTLTNRILGEGPEAHVDEHRWAEVFPDGLEPLFETVRDVKRYTNALLLTWPFVRGEVDAIDFLGIEALRVFTPKLYEFVRENRDLFAGPSQPRPLEPVRPEGLEQAHNRALQQGLTRLCRYAQVSGHSRQLLQCVTIAAFHQAA